MKTMNKWWWWWWWRWRCRREAGTRQLLNSCWRFIVVVIVDDERWAPRGARWAKLRKTLRKHFLYRRNCGVSQPVKSAADAADATEATEQANIVVCCSFRFISFSFSFYATALVANCCRSNWKMCQMNWLCVCVSMRVCLCVSECTCITCVMLHLFELPLWQSAWWHSWHS